MFPHKHLNVGKAKKSTSLFSTAIDYLVKLSKALQGEIGVKCLNAQGERISDFVVFKISIILNIYKIGVRIPRFMRP